MDRRDELRVGQMLQHFLLERLRHDDPVHYLAEFDTYLLTRYADIRHVEALLVDEVDPPARRAYQRFSPGEFAAELYLAYTACGSSAIRVMCWWLGCIHSSQPVSSTIVAAWP